jgi:naringenin degradation protein FdeD
MEAPLQMGRRSGVSETAPLRLCPLEELEDGAARGFVIGAGTERYEIFVYREGERLWGYRNECPHVGTPLDMAEDDFLSLDGSHFLCHTHGATFRIEDGFCIAGPCKGESLKPVALRLEAGWIALG